MLHACSGASAARTMLHLSCPSARRLKKKKIFVSYSSSSSGVRPSPTTYSLHTDSGGHARHVFTSHRQRRARGSTDQHGQARTGTHKPHKPHKTDKGPGPKVSAHQRHEREPAETAAGNAQRKPQAPKAPSASTGVQPRR
eukprot:1829137-Prymnesium_polylepis.1